MLEKNLQVYEIPRPVAGTQQDIDCVAYQKSYPEDFLNTRVNA